MITRVTVSMSLMFAHPDGVKLTRKAIRQYLRTAVEDDEKSAYLRVNKAVVRSVENDN